MPVFKAKTKPKTISKMTIEELRSEVASLRRSVVWLKNEANNPAVSAVDRNGKSYTRAEMVTVFERLYNDNPKAMIIQRQLP